MILNKTYSELQILYNKYNYNNIMKYFKGYVRPYYFIPPELVINTYSGSSIEIFNGSEGGLDWNYDNWIGCNALRRILKICCNLTIQEYFDILVLHINDIKDRPRCTTCGKYLNFSQFPYAGYGSGGHSWIESDFHFCSQSCSLEFRSSNPEAYSNYNEFLSNGGGFGIAYNSGTLMGTKDYMIYNETQRSKFINSGNADDICYFYITRSSNKFKFGITYDPDTRSAFGNSFGDYKSNLRIIVTGTRENIANLEYNIKINLKLKCEYIDWNLVPTFLKVFNIEYHKIFN